MTRAHNHDRSHAEQNDEDLERNDTRHDKPIDHCTASMIALLAVMLVIQISYIVEHRAGDVPGPAVRSTIDPNCDPWWELTVLPRIGDSLAKRIVAYRAQVAIDTKEATRSSVFHIPADLAHVKGIGPKTLARIGPYLRFD